MFQSIGQVIDAELEGKTRTYSFRKTLTGTYPSGNWLDLSSGSGNPAAKYWFDAPPLIAKAISQSSDGGLFHGANVSPSTKYLKSIYLGNNGAGAVPCQVILMDYLLYYPTIEDSITGAQLLNNTVTLPRYEDGEGVQAIAVSVAVRSGGQSFTINYTNSEGVSNRTSQTIYQAGNTTTSTIINSLSGGGALLAGQQPFIGLQAGDTGIRSIESVTMNSIDTGLFSIILVKPLAYLSISTITAPTEKNFLMNGAILPEIKDDAFLGLITSSSNSTVPNFFGDLKVIWE